MLPVKMKMGFMFTIISDPPEAPAPPASPFPRLLSALPAGASGRVAAVDAAAVDLERLEVMGLCPGRLVCVIKDGDPMIVRVLGTRIGLAAALAERVLLAPEAPPSSALGA
jgi:Fe2+ transport system protein FeoA